MEQIRNQIDQFYAQKDYEQAHSYMIDQLTQAIQQDQPLIILNLLCELMSYYRVHALFEQGNVMATRAVKLIAMLGQQDSLLAATTYLNIATLYRVEGLYDEARQFFDQCHAIYQKILPENDSRMISFYNNLSLLYQETSALSTAIEYSQKALALILQLPDAESEVAITYTNLAQMYFEQGDQTAGEMQLQQALALFEAHAPNDPHYFAARATKAQNHFLKQEYHQALQEYEQVLQAIERTFGHNADYERTLQNYHYVKQQSETGFGLLLCRNYYFAVGKPMLEKQFPTLLPYLAVGLVGMGSECLGYDDELSRDHDFGPGFCIWLPKEQYEQYGAALQQAYDQLPVEFEGYHRQTSAQGNGRVGVFQIDAFYQQYLGKFPKTDADWLALDEQSLLMMTAGEVFEDRYGRFTEIRKELQGYYPKTVWLQKLMTAVAKMAQSGQYNYPRLLKRGDFVASQLALYEFASQTITCFYLLNQRYQPYYKWAFRGLQQLPVLQQKVGLMQTLLQDNDQTQATIEQLCRAVVAELNRQKLTDSTHPFLQEHLPALQAHYHASAH